MNIAVFASGRGSNFQAILNAVGDGRLPALVALLVSNNSSAGALELARSQHIPAIYLSQKQCASEEAYVEQLLELLTRHKVDLIALAGYMKKIPVQVIARFRNRILNIHPALLPAFGGPGMYGIHVHEAVLASGVRQSGATVHIVDEEYDKGPIVMQKTVDVLPGDTPELLAARVLKIEHEIYPQALAAFAAKRVHIEGRSVRIQ
jgi:formyltetrahydrofolate-dependent phosphoribosylglycinamide formyltransferase